MRLRIAGIFAAAMLSAVALLASCAPSITAPTDAGSAPWAAEADVPLAARVVWGGSYLRDIQPIFNEYCTSCHGPTRAENGLRLDSYDYTMRGTQYGPVVVPGSDSTSTLVAVIEGRADPKIRMPHEGRKLTKNRIQNIVLWIEAGAPED